MNGTDPNWEALFDRARAGHVPSTSRLISALEAHRHGWREFLSKLHRSGGRAHVVGITGPPGSGKSTLVNALIRSYRDQTRTVAVIAVDPSSSLTGGAILGDRIRMLEHGLDAGVFVRSLSTRGAVGGVSRATVDAAAVLDASGWDIILIETIGVGQDELDIVGIAETAVVITAPGLGDDIQTIKAGLLEVADIHVVNKADTPGADKAVAELLAMLSLGAPPEVDGWAVPTLPTVALDGTGVNALTSTIDSHRTWLDSSGESLTRRRNSARARITSVAKDLLLEQIGDPSGRVDLEGLVESVVRRDLDPQSAAALLLAAVTPTANFLEKTG
jgi:LAO/AO transport system kinase